MGIGGFFVTILRLLLTTRMGNDLLVVEEWLNQPALSTTQTDYLLQQLYTWAALAFVILFVVFIGGWLVATWAQAAIIGGIVAIEEGNHISFGQTASMGWRWLGRFVAIDTIVYFPLFLVLLLIMLVAVIAMLGTVFASTQPASTIEELMTPLGLGAICLIPLLCSLLPLSVLSSLFRTLAFRDTVVTGNGVRRSIRHTWQVMKNNLGNFIVLGILLWGIHYLAYLLLRSVSIPLLTLSFLPSALSLAEGQATNFALGTFLISLFFEIVLLLPKAFINAFTITCWTLAYQDMIRATRH